jgi:lipid-binding SYLF domain-containing protein
MPHLLTCRRICIAKGVYADPGAGAAPTSPNPKAQESNRSVIDPTKEKPKNRVIVTIPPKVISKAVGLAIFTTLRAGFQVSGATGSGVLVARLPDGSWSPPSGIQVHSVGGGFQIGLDIYDCVCVINSKEALSAFMNTRVSLGSDLAVVAGPYGAGGAVEFGAAMQRGRGEADKKPTASFSAPAPGDAQLPTAALKDGQHSDNTLQPDGGDPKRRSLSASAFKPVFSYVKSRGFYAGIQVDGTVVVERKDANTSFYGAPVSVKQILQGQVPPQGPPSMWPVGARGLLETLKGAEAGALGDWPGVSGAAVAPNTGTEPGAGAYAPNTDSVPGGSSFVAPPAYVEGEGQGRVGDVKYA